MNKENKKCIALFVGIVLLGSCLSKNEKIQNPCECEFMSIAAIVQLVVGRALPKDDVAALFKTAATVKAVEKHGKSSPMIDPVTYKVNDRAILSQFIFTYMGWNDVWLDFQQAKSTENLVAYLGEYKNTQGEIHYAIYNTGKQCIWMYHPDDFGIEPQKLIPVYVRSKK